MRKVSLATLGSRKENTSRGNKVLPLDGLKTMKKLLASLISQLTIYVVQFLLLPAVVHIYPSDSHRNFMAISITTAVISIVGMLLFSDQLRFWLGTIVIYAILVLIYHPDNLYGIGYGMFANDIISIVVLTFNVMAVQIVCWIVVKTVKMVFWKD